jgi:methyl-accepting chemotaxis protein
VVVSETMTDVAGIASNTSNRATQVLTAFQDLLNVAQDLQTTVGQFKLQ